MKKPIYKKWWFWVILVIVIGGIGNMGKDTEATDQATPTATVEPAKEVVAEVTAAPTIEPTVAPTVAPTEQPIPGTIGMTPEQFRLAFNKAAIADNTDFQIDKLEVEDGTEQNTFTHALAKDFGFSGSVNKADGSVREVTLIGSNFESTDSVMNFFTAISTTLKATTSGLTPEDVQGVFKELGISGEDADLSQVDTDVIKNDIKYSLSSSQQLGVWFTVSDANEK